MSLPGSVGLVTCRVLPEPDPDRGLLLAALQRAGVKSAHIAWDDPAADPGAFDLLVIRSCWNYHERPDEFLGWIESAARRARILNPEAVVRWNLHKAYLRDLQAAGVPVVPTLFVGRGARHSLKDLLEDRGWNDIVIKPCISASSWRTHRFSDLGAEARTADAALRDLLRDRDAMIQPYVADVERTGERSVVWIDGEITHTIRKSPRFAGTAERVSEALPTRPDEREVAERAVRASIEATGHAPLYGRIDLMRDVREGPLVSELELIEPSLYLLQSPDGLDRLVHAIATAQAS